MAKRPLFLALVGETFRQCARHPVLYAGVTLAALVLQGALVLGLRLDNGLLIVPTLVQPVLATIAYARVAADRGGAAVTPAAFWERVLERVWAVILLDFAVAYIVAVALATALQGNFFERVLGTVALLYSATLVFADVIATVSDDVPMWLLLPLALWHSIRVAWSPGTFVRVVALLAIAMAVTLAQNGIFALMSVHHVAHASFWAQVPLATILTVPSSVLVVLVYLDATHVAA